MNPFGSIHADAWAEDAVDLPSLNQGVSDFLAQRIEEVSRGARGSVALRSSSSLILGPAGAGKTHLFARLRKQIGARAVFVYSRPELGADASPRDVLAKIAGALRHPVASDQHRQIDLIVGTLLAAFVEVPAHYPFLAITLAKNLDAADREALLQRVVDDVEDRFPEIMPKYLERLVRAPFASKQDARAIMSWLSGSEPSEAELHRIGEAGGLADIDLMPAISTLGVAAAFGAPIVLVFDQLENLVEDGGSTGRIHAHARVFCELRERVRGLVLVQMAVNAEWSKRIRPSLGVGERSRVEENVKHLVMPTPDERRALVAQWTARLPEPREPSPWPFSTSQIEAWSRAAGMTPRMLMQECGEAYARGPSAEPGGVVLTLPEPLDWPVAATAAVGPDERLAGHFERFLDEARRELEAAQAEDAGATETRLTGGLLAALRLAGLSVEKLAAREGAAMRIGGAAPRDVIIAQHRHHTSMGATVQRALTIAQGRSVALVREQALAVPPTWKKVDEAMRALAASPRAAIVQVTRPDMERLLALSNFLGAARSQDLSADDGQAIAYDDAVAWARASLGADTWAVTRALVGDAQAAAPPPPLAVARPAGLAAAALAALGVASIDRLVREAKRHAPSASRKAVLAELKEAGARVFGGTIAVHRGAAS